MEAKLVRDLAEYMLSMYFRSKRGMADAINVPYGVLLRVCSLSASARECRSVLDAILHYSVRNLIHLEMSMADYSASTRT